MILEQLQFMVHPAVKDDWLKFEEEEWLPWLQQQKGFVSKQIRISGGIATNMIWWRDKESWDKAADKREEMIPKELKMQLLFGSRVTRLRAI